MSGTVADTRTVRCPSREYAVDQDHLVIVDTGDHLVRLLHADPQVEPGTTIAVGDRIGTLVRSGYFARWVDPHLHVEYRDRGGDPYRASGSLPLDVGVRVTGLPWDGTGTVFEVGRTYVRVAGPDRRHPEGGPVAIAADNGTPLDGGLVHYAGGGAYGVPAWERHPLSLLGERVGVAQGRDVTWRDVTVAVDGQPATGLSLFVSHETVDVKVICPGHRFAVGDRIEVSLEPTADPVRLG